MANSFGRINYVSNGSKNIERKKQVAKSASQIENRFQQATERDQLPKNGQRWEGFSDIPVGWRKTQIISRTEKVIRKD